MDPVTRIMTAFLTSLPAVALIEHIDLKPVKATTGAIAAIATFPCGARIHDRNKVGRI